MALLLHRILDMREQNRLPTKQIPRQILFAAILAMVFVLLAGAAHANPARLTPDEVQDPVQWGEAKSVRRLRHLWIADQPDAAGFDFAKEAGIKVVIDLRAPGERDWDEAALVEARGLAYYDVPVVGNAPFSKEAFEEIERLVKANPGQQTLIHCSSGNRAAGWLTAHIVGAHGMSFESALAIGRRAGITKDTIVAKLATYLGDKVPSPTLDAEEREAQRVRASQIFGVLPTEFPSDTNPITDEKVELGRVLYYEPRISKNHDISCNSCHGLDTFGVDNKPTSSGHRGLRGVRNSPTVYNAALHLAQFWDGRAADVEEQAKGPIQNPVEMAMAGGPDVVAILRTIPDYQPLFVNAFPGEANPITFDNVARAIGAFERRLVTPSRFDDFVSGDLAALTDAELRGMGTFIDSGCIACHMGPGFGGQIYQKLGLVHPYKMEDVGRQELTGNETDKHFFKVPSLRNIAETHPYLHDGSVGELDEMVRLMGWHQLGRKFSEDDTTSILVFLRSLTGRIDAEFIAMPALPASGPDTPKPNPL